MEYFPNLVRGIGIPKQLSGDFPEGASLDIGEFGAVVVGLNGSGKSRFLDQIGKTFPVIYSQSHRHLFDGLDSFANQDLTTNPIDWINQCTQDHPSRANYQGFVTNFNKAWGLLNNYFAIREDDSIWAHFEEAQADMESDWRSGDGSWQAMIAALAKESDEGLTPLELCHTTISFAWPNEFPFIAAIFASLFVEELDWPADDGGYIIGLAISKEILDRAHLGLSFGDGTEESAISLWFNADPESTPVLRLILDLDLGTSIGYQLGSWEFGIFNPFESRVRGPFEFCLDLSFVKPSAQAGSVLNFDDFGLALNGLTATQDPKYPLAHQIDDGTRGYAWRGSGGFSFESRSRWLGPQPEPERDPGIERLFRGFEVRPRGLPLLPHPSDPQSSQDRLNNPPTYSFHQDDWLLARALSAVATGILQQLLPHAPIIALTEARGELHWRALVAERTPLSFEGQGSRLETLDLENLSAAEERWAKFAIGIADRYLYRFLDLIDEVDLREWVFNNYESSGPGPTPRLPGHLLLIDEPEMGLHRAVEEKVAEGVIDVCRRCNLKPIIATHSPIFIRRFSDVGASIFWVHRDSDHSGSAIECFTSTDIQIIGEAAGVNAPDLIQMMRAFLLVEGEHDKAVLEALFGDELGRLGVHIIPLRGAKGLSQVVDSAFLWRFSQARVLVLLDHLNEPVANIWREAVDLATNSEITRAQAKILQIQGLEGTGTTERKAVIELFHHAVAQNQSERIYVLGLKEDDILNYFDPWSVINIPSDYSKLDRSAARPWRLLSKEWRRSGTSLSFKSWLEEEFPGTRISAESLRNLVSEWDRIPQELTGLLGQIRSIVQA